MRGRVAKPRRTRRPKLSQENAVASEGAGTYVGSATVSGVGRHVDSPVKELPLSYSEQSQVSDLAQETGPLQSDTGQRDVASEIHSLLAKRARSTWTDRQRPGVEDEKAEQATKTALQRPKPDPPRHPYASSLEPKIERSEQVSPAARSWKRRIGSDVDDKEPQLARACLTRKNLALFNKMAKKKANKASASAPRESTVEPSTTKTTSTTSSGFAIQAYNNGILDPLHSKPPTNLEDIQKRHARPRKTISPPESVHGTYVHRVGSAVNEATMVVEVGGRLLKEYEDWGYQRAFNQAFTGFSKDVGFNNNLSAPQPDFVEGLEMQEYRPFPVNEHISGAVLYKDTPSSLTLPHLAGEWKGRGKDMEEARLQSAYDGAALVYARNQALSYIGKPDPPGHAEVTTFTTDGANLNFFAHYATPSEDGTLEYHQYPYESVNLKKYQEFKDGLRGLRNEQDHAREQSYALRDQLKEHWKQRRGGPHPITEGAPPPVPDGTSETNADEDEAGHEVVGQPCQPIPTASSQPCMPSSSVSSSKPLPTYE